VAGECGIARREGRSLLQRLCSTSLAGTESLLWEFGGCVTELWQVRWTMSNIMLYNLSDIREAGVWNWRLNSVYCRRKKCLELTSALLCLNCLLLKWARGNLYLYLHINWKLYIALKNRVQTTQTIDRPTERPSDRLRTNKQPTNVATNEQTNQPTKTN